MSKEKEQALIAFAASIKSVCPDISAEALTYIASGLIWTEMENKQFFAEAHVVQKHIGFVYQGLLRTFYIDHQGNEVTIRFTCENTYATNYPAFIAQTENPYYIQCLEPCYMLKLSYEHIQKCYAKHPIFERYGRLIAEEILKMQQSRIESFLFDNAEKRYVDFVKNYPKLFNRVSLSYLSSYLGIERPSLSRIRKKLASQ